MNRATRLSLIAVMLLATTALGTIGYKTMYPDLPPAPVKETYSPPPVPKPSEPKLNPEYQKLLADLDQHERRCLALVKQATILLPQSQNQAEQRVRECWNLVEIERKYVTNYPNKEIKQ